METINELKALKEEYKKIFDELDAKLDKKIAELEKTDKRWKPELGEKYYYICGTGKIGYNTYCDDSTDSLYYNFHNMFKTEKAAKFAAERWKVMRELEMLSDNDKVWDGINAHCAIQYTNRKESVHSVNLYHDRTNPFYFKSKESAQKAVDTIGEDRLKKYWFGVKEE